MNMVRGGVAPHAGSLAPARTGDGGARRNRKWLVAIALVVLCAACLLDAFFIEPFNIQVTHFDLQGNVAAPLKIVQFSDLHTHGLGRNEKAAFQILQKEKPDLIAITGDCLGNLAGNYRMCEQFYRRLHAPLGVWVVRGNWENDRPVYHERAFYSKAGVRLLVNQNALPRPDFAVIGLDDNSSGTPRLDRALSGVPADIYKIALFHAPGFFDDIAGRVNLCLAGHTHGGQIRIPFIKPFWLPKGCKGFVAGWYEEDGTKMYVNRGLGTSDLPVRFLCRPEITVVTIHPDGKPNSS
jgi:uncharacterized protein